MSLKNKALIIVNRKWALFPLVFVISVILFSWLLWSNTLIDPDSFYHARIVEMISQQGIIMDFPWQQETTLKDNFADHHLFYHILLVPLVKFCNPLVAVKIGAVLFSSLFMLFLAWYLKQRKVKFILFYLLLLLTMAPFLVRMSLPKATPLALLLFFLGIYFIEQKKYLALFCLSFVYVWSHGGFILLLVVGIVLILTKYIYNTYHKILIDRDWSLLYIFGGLLSGLIINPYFPKNLLFYWQQVVQIGIINYKDEIEVGAEWYSYNLPDLIGATSLAWILIIISLVVFCIFIKKQNLRTWQWLLLMLIFFVATLRSRRFVEYFVPVAFVWSALLVSWYLNTVNFTKQYNKFKKYLVKRNIWTNILIVYLVITIPFGISHSIVMARRNLKLGFDYTKWQQACEYLEQNSEAGEIVWHGKWDDWPILFYQNQHNYYLVGLDATFMYKQDKEKYILWQDIAQGKIKEDLDIIIKNNFNSRFIFIDKKEEDTKLLRAYLMRNEKIDLAYDDEQVSIYEIK